MGTSAANKVKRGDLRHAIVVRTAKKLQRKDGSVVRFDDNACVLINKVGEPIGTRLNGESIRSLPQIIQRGVVLLSLQARWGRLVGRLRS